MIGAWTRKRWDYNWAVKRVAVGLSGGVDSAVSGLLLRDQGYEVVGVHLYCWPPRSEYRGQRSVISEDEEKKLRSDWIRKNGCRADEDEQMALKTALELGIKFVKLDFSEEYNKRVVDYFYAEYEAGRTPNPDVLCNSEIKFGLFLDWALKNNFDYIATGHYASLQKLETEKTQNLKMMIPKDRHKDQTYFLWKLTQKELNHVLFPLGDLLKSEVRGIAGKNNLSVANRKDSQGICFIGNVEAREFLARRLKKKMGVVRSKRGEIIGEHDGVWFYTIGQRGGWRLNAKSQKLEKSKNQRGDVTPIYYVISKNAAKNELVVGVGEETEFDSFEIAETNWIDLPHPSPFLGKERELLVRIRHGGELINGELRMVRQLADGKLGVKLEKGVRGIAPGQSAVFYTVTGEVLGGGVIV